MADKTKRVMAAIKGRDGVAPKKGVALLAIMSKLTAKRKAAKESDTPAHEKAESSKKESTEDGAGGPGWDKFKQSLKGVVSKFTPTRTSPDELIRRSGAPISGDESKQKMLEGAQKANDQITRERTSSSSTSPLQRAKDEYYKNKIPGSK